MYSYELNLVVHKVVKTCSATSLAFYFYCIHVIKSTTVFKVSSFLH